MLILVSVIVLGLSYDIVSFKSANINLSFITINEFKVNKPGVINVVVLSVLIIAIYIQLKSTIKEFATNYSRGYKNLTLVEFVQNHIAAICGHSAHGAPFGNLKPGLFKKQIKPGKFTIPNRGLSDELSIDLPNSVHLKSVLSGLLAAIFSKYMVFGVLPIILGIWSIKVIVI